MILMHQIQQANVLFSTKRQIEIKGGRDAVVSLTLYVHKGQCEREKETVSCESQRETL